MKRIVSDACYQVDLAHPLWYRMRAKCWLFVLDNYGISSYLNAATFN